MLIKYDAHGVPNLKLCDFGFATFLCYGTSSSPNVATAWYRAPEICWEISDYSYKSDIFSLGVIVYEIFTAKILFQDLKDQNTAIFNGILARIPLEMTSDIVSLYKKKCKSIVHIELPNTPGVNYVKPPSFLSRFKKLSWYRDMSEEMWINVEKLLLETLNLNYRERKATSECLKLPFFNSKRETIKVCSAEIDELRNLSPILIVKNDRIYAEKCSAFDFYLKSTRFLNKKVVFIDEIRIMFHALDLTNRYFNKYPDFPEVTKVVYSSIYFFQKYFKTTEYPEYPEYYFPYQNQKWDSHLLEELDKWIFNFEKDVIQNVLIKYDIYRSGLFEMADEYGHKLVDGQLYILFYEFLSLSNWNGRSYRFMYREFYKKLFDPEAKF